MIMTVHIMYKLFKERKEINAILSISTILCFISSNAMMYYFLGLAVFEFIDFDWYTCNIMDHWTRNRDHSFQSIIAGIISIIYGFHYLFLVIILYIRLKFRFYICIFHVM